jgi:hypothetical protein
MGRTPGRAPDTPEGRGALIQGVSLRALFRRHFAAAGESAVDLHVGVDASAGGGRLRSACLSCEPERDHRTEHQDRLIGGRGSLDGLALTANGEHAAATYGDRGSQARHDRGSTVSTRTRCSRNSAMKARSTASVSSSRTSPSSENMPGAHRR